MLGSNLCSSDDILKKADIHYLYSRLINPKPEITSRINQLRIVYSMDKKAYSVQKRTLPYFVCGSFNPPLRKKENFAYTEYFVLDLDDLQSHDLSADILKEQLRNDENILLIFSSPSGNGLKLIFRLKDRCYDPAVYSIFYRTFAKAFASKHHIDMVIDGCTSDVSRACFISVDPQAVFHENAEPVDMESFIGGMESIDLLDLRHNLEEEAATADNQTTTETKESHDPSDEIIEQIRQTLNPQRTKKKAVDLPFVPEEIESIIGGLRDHILSLGVEVTDIRNISYGKKLCMKTGIKRAEVNIFYGKRGFSVVISPRCGTDKELNKLLSQSITQYIDSL